MQKFPMTPKGYEKLQSELHILKTVERPAIIKDIAEARAHGDLSENAEYSSAREKQGFIEAKIADLEAKESRAFIIEPSSITGTQVKFGATVTLLDEDTNKELKYQIVGEYEANLAEYKVSVISPIAKALISKEENESFEVQTPGGFKYYKILKVEYI